jgi:hypothetical protein
VNTRSLERKNLRARWRLRKGGLLTHVIIVATILGLAPPSSESLTSNASGAKN